MNILDFSELSESGLLSMHLALLNAFKDDEKNPNEATKKYHVRKTKDWKEWSDFLENELDNRSLKYEKVPW